MTIRSLTALALAALVTTGCAQGPTATADAPPDAERPPAAATEAAPEPEPEPEPEASAETEAAEAPPPREPGAVDPIVYAARADGERVLAAIDPSAFAPKHLRAQVPYETTEPPGTIIIEAAARQLYFVMPDGTAMRYGVSIGKEGFGWTGEGVIARHAKWPRWTPPPEMIKRKPELAEWKDGMPGGPNNPLGARALYIFFGEQDSGYRIHGTNEPTSIGHAASSGCFRMINQDVVDLYERVPTGAKVIVR